MLTEGQDRETIVWIHGQARRMATYVRRQKQAILLPSALPTANADVLSSALGEMLVHAAWGNWAACGQDDPPAVVGPSGLLRILRGAVAVALPLVILGILLLIPAFAAESEMVKSSVVIPLVGLSVMRVASLVNPQLREDLATVKDGLDLLPHGSGA